MLLSVEKLRILTRANLSAIHPVPIPPSDGVSWYSGVLHTHYTPPSVDLVLHHTAFFWLDQNTIFARFKTTATGQFILSGPTFLILAYTHMRPSRTNAIRAEEP